MLKVVALSDTHNRYEEIPPAGDLLIIAGDVLTAGSVQEYGQFRSWLEKVRSEYRFVVYVPGNHDIYVEQNETLVKQELKDSLDIDVLIDEQRIYKFDERGDINLYGAPWVPQIGVSKRWAYEIPRMSDRLKDKWDLIPEGLDILVTHGPPHRILDNIIYEWSGRESPHWGCELMRKRLENMETPPRHSIYGHVHSPVQGKYMEKHFGTSFHNVAICDEFYAVEFEPKVIEL